MKMKKLSALAIATASAIALVSCGGGSKGGSTGGGSKQSIETPNVTINGNVISWNPVANAKNYVVQVNGENQEAQETTTYVLPKTGTFTYKVKAVTNDFQKYASSDFSVEKTYTLNLTATTIWVVGDSTVCDYAKERDTDGNVTAITDVSYFYDRFGYATQFENVFEGPVTVKNLAMSGRSAKSFLSEDNYATLTSQIKKGDYLVVGFGHNDEKYDDATRFADASKGTDVEGSFKNVLYEKYAKIALDKQATPILCTPIVRYNEALDYTGKNGHVLTLTQEDVTKYSTTLAGHKADDKLDYRQAVLDLGAEKNIATVDLTKLTADKQTELGKDGAIKLHAVTTGLSDNEPNMKTVDTTHINIYGAKMYAYLFAEALKSTTCSLKDYVNYLAVEPTEADLVKNKFFVYTPYEAYNWAAYEATDNFTTITEGWYGTTFGSNGGTTKHIAKETSAGVFKVGNDTSSPAGKFAASLDGFGLVFRQVSSSKNFKLSGSAKIISTQAVKQSGFGIMLRDDCYAPNKVDVATNYIAAGLLQNDGNISVGWKREATALVPTSDVITGSFAANDTATFEIERLGQVVTTKITYKGTTYTATYTDFDLVGVDGDNMYVGFFANRGTMVEFTSVNFQITGDSQGA